MGLLLLIAGVAAILALALQRQEAQATPTAPDAAPPPPPGPLYAAGRLNAKQRDAADIIITAAQAGGMNPAFMIALAVTESSLGLFKSGDAGKSLGLFQLKLATARDYAPTITTGELLDNRINAGIAMKHMRSLIRQHPGATVAEYAEGWALGGRGNDWSKIQFDKKALALQNAIAYLDLPLTVNEVLT